MEIQGVSPVKAAQVEAGPAQKTGDSKFLRVLRELDKGESFIERTMRSAMKGRDFSPQELLAIQAGVYSYTQKIEIFSKLVDRATSSIRQLMNPQ